LPAQLREDSGMWGFLSNYWWLIFIVGPMTGGALQQHHARRLKIIAAKAELAEKQGAALKDPPEPQPICGCGHHLSFHNPRTGGCAEQECRCQQYVGPEPLGHVFAQPLINPGVVDPGAIESPEAGQN